MFNIITRKTLLDYCKKYPAASTALLEWYHELVNSDFKNFNELKRVYGKASVVADDRVVFNIMGNKYRLVVRIVFISKLFRSNGLVHMPSMIKLMLLLFNIQRNNYGAQNH